MPTNEVSSVLGMIEVFPDHKDFVSSVLGMIEVNPDHKLFTSSLLIMIEVVTGVAPPVPPSPATSTLGPRIQVI